jgi:hypothetical protein
MRDVHVRTVRSVAYHLSANRTPLRVCVVVTGDGSGSVSGWIAGDWKRAARVGNYLAALPRLLWERGDASRFVYAFGARTLSRTTARDIAAIMQRSIPRRRGSTTRTKGQR